MRVYLLAREGADSVSRKRGRDEGWYWIELEARKLREHPGTVLPPLGKEGGYVAIAVYRGAGRDSVIWAWEITQEQLALQGRPSHPEFDRARYLRGLRWWRRRHPVSDASDETLLSVDELRAYLVGRVVAAVVDWEREMMEHAKFVQVIRYIQSFTVGRLGEAFRRGFTGAPPKCPWEKLEGQAEQAGYKDAMRFIRKVVGEFKEQLRSHDPELAALVARVEREMPDTRKHRGHPR